MPLIRNLQPIPIGLVSDHPIRLEGLVSIFGLPTLDGRAALLPIPGSLPEVLRCQSLEYLVVDIDSSTDVQPLLDSIRRTRPGLRLIVIGPAGNDELALQAIIGGARAYLDINTDAATVRRAVDEVTSGSIWAPRRLLSKLIDRLLKVPDSSLTNATPHLTDREHQVLELIMLAHSNREIARQLGIEERTVKSHVGRLMRKTGADNRIELTMRALNSPLLHHTHAHALHQPQRKVFRDDSRLLSNE